MNRIKPIVSRILMSLTILLIFAQAQNTAVASLLPGDAWAAALEAEKGKREKQAALIAEQQPILDEAIRPIQEKQKSIEREQAPLMNENEANEKKRAANEVWAKDYRVRCNSRTFMPSEKATFDACNIEVGKLNVEKARLHQEQVNILERLTPHMKRWMKLDDEMFPFKLKLRENKSKLSAINTEIVRLNAIFGKCKSVAEKCTNGDCTPQDTEVWVLCEAIPFDGTNSNRYSPEKFGYLAALNPKLPPLDWKPELLMAAPNK